MFTNSIGINFASIPAGSFLMGSPIDEPDRHKDETQHLVHITKPFLLSITTVTQEQWMRVMGDNPSYFKDNDNLPVEMVNWYDSVAFCQKLSKKERLNYCLPTESEWEYACRAGTTTPFNTGDAIILDMIVGTFRPNTWGLYNMHGNILQWCSDLYAQYPEGEVTDPDTQDESVSDEFGSRVLRGNSWCFGPRYCRTASRSRDLPGSRLFNVGFRLAVGAADLI